MLGTISNKALGPQSSAAEDNPLWLIVLCDLMTNLMLFFLVLYSFTLKSAAERAAAMAEMEQAARGEMVIKRKPPEELAAIEKEQEAAASIVKEFERAGLADLSQVDVTESQIRIQLSSPLLFASGSAEPRAAGWKRLRPVARMLAGLSNTIMVEGHTDAIPIGKSDYRNNRELSSARAAAVVRKLITDYKVPARRLVVAGFGEHRPIGDNATARGRAKNRRIEMVIVRRASPAVLGKVKGEPK